MSETPRTDSDAMWKEVTAMAEAWCKELAPCQRDRAIYCYRAGYLKATRTAERELNETKARLEAAEKEARELREDKAMLNWLIEKRGLVGGDGDLRFTILWTFTTNEEMSFRKAIRQAMERKK